MNPTRCLVIDDEPLAIDVIENYLGRLRDVEVVRSLTAIDAIRIMQFQKFDVIFLDIEMPLLTGFDFLKTIRNPPAVIITTAYRDYAVEGFEYEVTDYLVKPISFPRFMKAFERALKQNEKPTDNPDTEHGDFLFLKVDRKLVKILFDEIRFVESMKDYVKVHTKTAVLISYQSLTAVTDKLPHQKFMRVHRSFTIALDKIDSMDGNNAIVGNDAVPISRELKQELLRQLKND
jgi:DNA-binding LytR/AlgR family response regulator